MKKIFAVLLILLLSMGTLAGCAEKVSDYEDDTDEKRTKVETTVETENSTTEQTTDNITENITENTTENTTEETTIYVENVVGDIVGYWKTEDGYGESTLHIFPDSVCIMDGYIFTYVYKMTEENYYLDDMSFDYNLSEDTITLYNLDYEEIMYTRSEPFEEKISYDPAVGIKEGVSSNLAGWWVDENFPTITDAEYRFEVDQTGEVYSDYQYYSFWDLGNNLYYDIYHSRFFEYYPKDDTIHVYGEDFAERVYIRSDEIPEYVLEPIEEAMLGTWHSESGYYTELYIYSGNSYYITGVWGSGLLQKVGDGQYLDIWGDISLIYNEQEDTISVISDELEDVFYRAQEEEEITTETTEEIIEETTETTTETTTVDISTVDISKFLGVWHSPAEDFGDWGHGEFWLVINDDLTYGSKDGYIYGTLTIVDENTLMDMDSSDTYTLRGGGLLYFNSYGEGCFYYREGQEP